MLESYQDFSKRDDFTAATKRALAERVGHLCSNPMCNAQTIGPSSEKDKTINIGVGAHITAALPGGKRYNAALTPFQRSDSTNGIWLCQNCAKLIDSDEMVYTVLKLNSWKHQAEENARKAVSEKGKNRQTSGLRPFAEPDLILATKSKRNAGPSLQNIILQKQNGGRPIHQFDFMHKFKIIWRYSFKIYNNSSLPLFNIKIRVNKQHAFFTLIDKLPKVNNIPPLSEMSLNAEFGFQFEGTGSQSLPIMKPVFPPQLNGMQFIFEYQDELRKVYFNECTFNNGSFLVNPVSEIPIGYED